MSDARVSICIRDCIRNGNLDVSDAGGSCPVSWQRGVFHLRWRVWDLLAGESKDGRCEQDHTDDCHPAEHIERANRNQRREQKEERSHVLHIG